jgi:hypothetical protein
MLLTREQIAFDDNGFNYREGEGWFSIPGPCALQPGVVVLAFVKEVSVIPPSPHGINGGPYINAAGNDVCDCVND